MSRNVRTPTARKLAEYAVFFGAVQKMKELTGLTQKLKTRKLKTVVEIGTLKGGTFWLWCQLAESDAKLVSIDLPGGPFAGDYNHPKSVVKKLFSYAKDQQQVSVLRGNSHSLAMVKKLQKSLKGSKVDLLFIDGDHSYKGVSTDFELYHSFVKKGGLIVFHDIYRHPKIPQCQVYRLWNRVKRNYTHWELFEENDDRGWGTWGGIGIIKV